MSAIATGRSAALCRAATLIGGAAFIALLGSTFAKGDPYTDQIGRTAVSLSIAAPSQAHSPVELAAVKQASEQQCLAEVMYYEARGEGLEGQTAVAEVVLARTLSKLYPKTICGVVYQGAERRTGCQFSFACDGSLKRSKQHAAWDKAQVLAAKIVNGSLRLAGQTKNAVSFHTVGVSPVWSATMLRVAQVGNHVFYRHMPKGAAPVVQMAIVQPVKVRFMPAGDILPEIEVAAEPAPAEVQVADLSSGGV